MDMGEVFRRLFGFPNRPPHHSSPHHPESDWHRYPPHNSSPSDGAFYNEDDDDHEDGVEFFFGSTGKDGLDGMFEHFNGGIFQQMEHLHRQMDEMMRGFGSIQFFPDLNQPGLPPSSPPSIDSDENDNRGKSSIWFGNSSPLFHQGPGAKPNSPRDFMLKEGAKDDLVTSDPVPEEKGPTIGPIYSPQKPAKNIDSDLDGKMSDHDIISLVKPQVESPEMQPHGFHQPQQPRGFHQPGFFSSSSSVSFSSYSGADGKVEKKKVVRDSSGREETTVTRLVGDKAHSVTTVTKHDGTQEKHETFENMDEKDIGNFEKVWSSPQSQRPSRPADDLVQPYIGPRIDPHDRDLFSQLFGFGGRK